MPDESDPLDASEELRTGLVTAYYFLNKSTRKKPDKPEQIRLNEALRRRAIGGASR